jgi:hypothetical protein
MFCYDHILTQLRFDFLLAYVLKYGFGYDIDIEDYRYEGNPSYMNAIPLRVLKRQLATGYLSNDIAMRYQLRIEELESQMQLTKSKKSSIKATDKKDTDNDDADNIQFGNDSKKIFHDVEGDDITNPVHSSDPMDNEPTINHGLKRTKHEGGLLRRLLHSKRAGVQ